LSFKYDISHLQEDITKFLGVIFPADLDLWDHSCRHIHPVLDAEQPGWDILLANCAREHNILAVLPAALFKCCLRPWSDVVDDICLNRDNFRAIMLAKPVLDHRFHTQTFKFLRENSRERTIGCTSTAYRICCNQRAMFRDTLESVPMLDSIDILSRHLVEDMLAKLKTRTTTRTTSHLMISTEGYCAACSTADRKSFEIERVKLWEELPEIFGLREQKDLPSTSDASHGVTLYGQRYVLSGPGYQLLGS